ncbi:GTP pyrophosphokinase family protein [Corallococcus macrosporus]|uniref:RelA/SpoT domain-containing protein n=1 Tax=Myxococcus fulvus (strain ATCC BAA-855 / HW-1) TaxID=483219 RepID=F8CFD5_MYXFH|nr:hypothetical protein [Corallococcus macrosporus]AEI62443.1 hypothetical protein LILAB_02590 [Corallococcus macrosporus]
MKKPKGKAPKKPSAQATPSTSTHTETYSSIHQTLNAFTEKTHILLKELTDRHGIKPQSIERRTKTIESFREKINRPGKNYTDPLNQLTDLSGHRIIVHYLDDIDKVSKIIEQEFNIDKAASSDKRANLAPHELGYLSRHFIISLKHPRTTLPEWNSYANFKAEVQLRTVLQHAWAAIEHSLQYKSEVDIPSNSRRRLFRLSGLLELADEEFNLLQNEQQHTKTEIRKALRKGSSGVEINTVTISAYLEQSKTPEELLQSALSVGFTLPDEEHPLPNKAFNDHYVSGVASISQDKTENIGSLDAILRKNKESIEFFLKALFAARPGSVWLVTKPFVLMLSCYFVFREELSVEMLIQNGWSKNVAEIVVSTAKNQPL